MFPIQLTETAAKKTLGIMETEGKIGAYLRIGIRGGGCSGFEYVLDFANEVTDFDMEEEQHGLKVIIDQVSASHLEGTVIDYVDGLHGTGYKFNNPNAQRHCGCGQSFS